MIAGQRELISTRLLALLAGVTRFATISRKFQPWDQIDDPARPALFLTGGIEDQKPEVTGQPGMTTLLYTAYIYLNTQSFIGAEPDPPISYLNRTMDEVEAVLAPDAVTDLQSLGKFNSADPGSPPLVHHCWIEGRVIKIAGDIDGNGVIVIPMSVLVPY